MEGAAPKVEVQGVPGVYDSTVQQPQNTPRGNQESQNGLDEFLSFDTKPNGVKQEPEGMETEQVKEEVVETTEEENVDVVFEVNGQKINACMSASMAQMLKESEEMRLQVIDKIMAEAGNNPDQPVTVTTAETSSRDTSATESADSPKIKTEPGIVATATTTTTATVIPRLNGQTLGKRPIASVISADNKNPRQKAVTRGSLGIVKPKLEQKFVPTSAVRQAVIQKNPPLPTKAFMWDHKAIVALIECYKSVNDRVTAMGVSKTVDIWNIIGKRMRVRGFQVSDMECKSKFATLTISHPYSFKSKKSLPPEKSQTWAFNKSTENALGDDCPSGKAKLLNRTKPGPRAIPVITVEDDSPGVSDGEGLEDDEETGDPTSKKTKTDCDATAIDKFRRTYLRVETEKLKEMKATRALQQEQCKLQRERNEILNSIATLLGLQK